MERDFALTDMKGIREEGNDLTQDPRYAARLENLRPEIGRLVSIEGNSLHSTFGYKLADRPTTLIRWATEDGAPFFMMTAWDNVFVFQSGEWVPLLTPSESSGYVPSNLLYWLNRFFDYCIYKNILFLTDGSNNPLKYDGTKIGTWGFRIFSGAASPLRTVQQWEVLAEGVALNVGTYSYYASLYDSVHAVWGNRGTVVKSQVVTDTTSKVWVHLDSEYWNDEDNYDFENAHADKIKIWRNRTRTEVPAVTDDNLYLAGTIKKGLIVASTGTIEEAGGTLTDNSVNFASTGAGALSVSAGDAISVNGAWKQVSVVAEHVLTLLNEDGDAYTDGFADGDYSYTLWPGFIDTANDLVNKERYHGELDPAEDHSPPEACKYCEVFGDRGNRVFMAGDANAPNRLYYSEIDLVDYWPLENWIDIDPDDSDEITGLVKFKGRLWIFKRNSVSVGNVDGDPYTWSFTAKVLSIGTANRRVIADCGLYLIFANASGLWIFDGNSQPAIISHPKDGSNIKALWDLVVKDELIRSQAIYNAKKNEFWISVAFDDARGMYDSALDGRGNVEAEITTPF